MTLLSEILGMFFMLSLGNIVLGGTFSRFLPQKINPWKRFLWVFVPLEFLAVLITLSSYSESSALADIMLGTFGFTFGIVGFFLITVLPAIIMARLFPWKDISFGWRMFISSLIVILFWSFILVGTETGQPWIKNFSDFCETIVHFLTGQRL